MSNLKDARDKANRLSETEAAYNAAQEKANRTLEDWKTLVKKN